MRTELTLASLSGIETELLAVLAADTQTGKGPDAKPAPALLTADKQLQAAAAAVLESGEFKAGANETLLLHAPAGLKAKRLLIVGLGKLGKATVHGVRDAAGTAVRFAKPRGIRELAFVLPQADGLDAARSARAAAEGALVGDFDPDTYRSDRKDLSVQKFTLAAPDKADRKALEAGFAEGVIVGESQNFARSLVNEPGNKLTPTVLGQRAAEMAAETGLQWEVHSTEKLHELKMGAFWSVSQGSEEPPALIVLRYEPEGGAKDGPVLHPTDKDPSVGTPVLHPTDKDLSVGTPVLHPTDKDLSVGTPVLHPTDKDLSVGTPVLHPTDKDLSVGTPVLHPTDKDLSVGTPVLHPTDKDLSVGTPVLHPTDKDLSVGTPVLHPTDKDLSVGTPVLHPTDKDLSVGTPVLHPTDKDLSVGTPVLHPTDKDLSVGTPVLHPTDKDLSVGTPVLHPTDKDLSVGTPVLHPTDKDLSVGTPVLGLVGKGITFDTGGISIKPADNMEKMKYDMAGGAAMLGAMRAIALLKPKVRVIGIVCAAENMPDGKAQKPGDVQTAMSGKTIEIINTDAEGRLVLADGLSYARQLGATHLIDAATLTGACVVALGMVNAGAFSNDDATFQKFDSALAVSGEKFWRLPLGDEYAEMIKSDIGDIKNTGGRWGGAITAAEFLKVFAEETPWIHLDIAGMAWVEDSRPYIAKGPSGIAVRSILEWVRSY